MSIINNSKIGCMEPGLQVDAGGHVLAHGTRCSIAELFFKYLNKLKEKSFECTCMDTTSIASLEHDINWFSVLQCQTKIRGHTNRPN
jgi:hypothetical protein